MNERDDTLQREIRDIVERLRNEAKTGRHDQAVEELLDLGASFQEWGAAFALDEVINALSELIPGDAVEHRAWLLNLLGWRALQLGLLAEARGHFEEMLRLGNKTKNRHIPATALMNLGNVATLVGDLPGALSLYRKSAATRSRRDAYGRLQCELNEASVLMDLGKDDEAERILDRADRRTILRDALHLRASAEGIRGQLAVRHGDLPSAEERFRRSMHLARKTSDLGQYLIAIQNLGAVNLDMGKNGRALRWLRRAHRAATRLEILRDLDGIERTMATALHRSGRFAEAERLLSNARDAANTRQDRLARARLTADLGSLLLLRGQADRAGPFLAEARADFLAAADSEWTIRSTLNLAEAHARRGQMESASAVVDEALGLLHFPKMDASGVWTQLGDLLLPHDAEAAAAAYKQAAFVVKPSSREEVADLLAESGAKFSAIGQYRQAVTLFAEALSQRVGRSDITVAQILNDRGIAWAALDELSEAESDLRSGLRASQRSRDRVMQALVVQNLSEVVRRQNRGDEAMRLAQQAVELTRETGDLQQEADALATLGLAQIAIEALDEAVETLKSSMKRAKVLGLKPTQATALGGLASIEYLRERYRSARNLYQSAASLEGELHDVRHEAESVGGILQASAHLNDSSRTEKASQRLVDLVEKENGPLSVALHAFEAAGLILVRENRIPEAASLYAVAVVLAGSQSDEDAFVEAIGRAVIAPFIHARLAGADESRVAQELAAALRTHLQHLPRWMSDLIATARETARESITRRDKNADRPSRRPR
jgi:tetratricopeptide (TPR) repeat protein